MVDLSTTDTRKQLVSKYASKHGLDPVLLSAVIAQESSWNPWAVRYEQDFYVNYIMPLVRSGDYMSDTEGRLRAFSFGLMQIMGQVAREFGYTDADMLRLCDPDVNLEYGCRKLKRCIDQSTETSTTPEGQVSALNLQAALLRYNGGGNKEYPGLIIARMKELSQETEA